MSKPMRGPFVRRAVRLAAGAAVVVAAAGCSGGGSSSQPSTSPSATTASVDTLAAPTVVTDRTADVRAIDNDFTPKHLQIRAGTTVRFTNVGHNKHNIISEDPKHANFSEDEHTFVTGSSYTATFDRPGTYPYYCSLHATPTAGSMRGVITVTR